MVRAGPSEDRACPLRQLQTATMFLYLQPEQPAAFRLR